MILTKTVKIKWNVSNRSRYIEKGYNYTKLKDEFEINIKDLSNGSEVLVNVKCDNPNCENPYLNPIRWVDYLKCVKEDGKYYCLKCAINLFANKNATKTKLKNSKSFEQWCIENHRQDVLDRWDYELNNCFPSEICYSSKGKFWFRCPINKHNSELKDINSFIHKSRGSINCKACNSFAQWGIDNICRDFLEKYWDYNKNKNINPWQIDKGSTKKVYINCQSNINHESYPVSCHNFYYLNNRCPQCNNSKGENRINQILKKKKIYFIQQKTFDDLVGLRFGLLSYDFYLPQYNLFIEYQGEFHDGSSGEYSKKNIKRQQEHDRRKREYAKQNNYNLLEIWYYDFDKIEEILDNYLKEAS